MSSEQPYDDVVWEQARIERSMTNQPPIHDDVVQVFETLRTPFKDAGKLVVELIPPCAERTLAIRKIEEGLMWAVKAVALNQQATLDRIAKAQKAKEAGE